MAVIRHSSGVLQSVSERELRLLEIWDSRIFESIALLDPLALARALAKRLRGRAYAEGVLSLQNPGHHGCADLFNSAAEGWRLLIRTLRKRLAA